MSVWVILCAAAGMLDAIGLLSMMLAIRKPPYLCPMCGSLEKMPVCSICGFDQKTEEMDGGKTDFV